VTGLLGHDTSGARVWEVRSRGSSVGVWGVQHEICEGRGDEGLDDDPAETRNHRDRTPEVRVWHNVPIPGQDEIFWTVRTTY
jgi:hypothetical protein